MSKWSRFQSQFRETPQERRERINKQHERYVEDLRLYDSLRGGPTECTTCPPADAIADERRCPECPWRAAQ